MFVSLAIITLLFSILYACLILNFRRGWNKLEGFSTPVLSGKDIQFSIIISARNEARNIGNCLADIVAQDYPNDNFEIIVVDDFSEDHTADIVAQFAAAYPAFQISIIRMVDEAVNERNSFKKAAIRMGIAKSKNPWIITSDADCRRGVRWLSTIAGFIDDNSPVMVSAPVCLDGSGSFFDQAQSIEFMGLVGIGAASIALKSPNMCNGANLIYQKQAFYDVNGFEGYDSIASGDDEFLMHKMFKKWPDKINFLKNPDAIVYTQPETSLGSFIQQRKRWVSKSRKYADSNITAVLSGAWIFHLSLLICLVSVFFDLRYMFVFLLAFGIKVLAEYALLTKTAIFFNKRKTLSLLVPSAFLYIFYVLFIGIYGNFGGYKWKGREVR